MQMPVDQLKHAKAAVERSAIGLSDLSSRLKKGAAGAGRAHRAAVEDTVGDLTRLHTMLSGYYSDMVLAPKEALPALWRRFYVCYDEYLEAARLARTGLARDDRGNEQGAAPTRAQGAAEKVDSKES